MDNKRLTSMEMDAIGEILNISLGASATAVSTMLDARVDITTPTVQVKKKEEFEFSSLEPAVGVEITYIEGLTGSNIMLLKRSDVKTIVEMLMGVEIPEDEFELDEMNISAICEVMNQMMGASSTALSELLSKTVNISTPVSFEIEDAEQFKEKYFQDQAAMVVIGFDLSIADRMKSEFINLMPIELAKELVAGFFPDGVPPTEQAPAEEETEEKEIADEKPETAEDAHEMMLSQNAEEVSVAEETKEEQAVECPAQSTVFQPEDVAPTVQASDSVPIPEPQAQQTQPVMPAMTMDAGMMQQMMDMMRQQLELQQQQLAQMQKNASGPKQIKVSGMAQPNIQPDKGEVDPEANLDLIMGVPLDISVEIGRTKQFVKDILELNKGSLVVLDKLAGEQVDVFVNGQCIAKGDVVVVEDNFGVRITEILQDEIVIESQEKAR